MILGAAAQFGIFFTLFGAIAMNLIPGMEFSMADAAAIAIIGGADGPTAIYVASRPCARPARRHRRGGLFLHGTGTDHPATDHEGC